MKGSALLDLAQLAAADDSGAGDAQAGPILDAAIAQFQDFGLRRSSMEDIARRAGVSRVTLYRRYPQKDRLVQAVILRECRRVIGAVRSAMRGQTRFEDRIVEGFVCGMNAIHGDPLLNRLLAVEPEDVLVFLTLKANPYIAVASGFLAEQIRLAQRSGDLPAYPPQPMAELLVRIIHSLSLTPKSGSPMSTPVRAREFARTYIVPILMRGPDV